MPSLSDLPELAGFFSYSREDDEGSKGALSALRDAIHRELSAQLGRSKSDFRLWQDKEAIAPGKLWESDIRTAVEQSVFFVPVVTPRVLKSKHCKFEFESFLAREKALRRTDLVFPVLYMTVPALEDEAQWRKDALLSILGTRQHVDWRPFRHLDAHSTSVREAVERFCSKIVAALNAPMRLTPALPGASGVLPIALEEPVSELPNTQPGAQEQYRRETEARERAEQEARKQQEQKLAAERRKAQQVAKEAEVQRVAAEAERQRKAQEAARAKADEAREAAAEADQRRQKAQQAAAKAEAERKARESLAEAERQRLARELSAQAEARRHTGQEARRHEQSQPGLDPQTSTTDSSGPIRALPFLGAAFARRMLNGAALPVLLLALWEAASFAGAINPFLLPAPSAILADWVQRISSGQLLPAAASSLARLLLGGLIGVGLALILGQLIAKLPRIGVLTYTFFRFLDAIPPVAYLPLFTILLGMGMSSGIAGTAIAAFFVQLLHSREGGRSLDGDPQRGLRALAPAALTLIFSVALVSEFIAGYSGLGTMTLMSASVFDLRGVLSTILTVGLIGFGIRAVAQRIDGYWLRRAADPEHAHQMRSGLPHLESARRDSIWHRVIGGALVPVLVIAVWQVSAMLLALPYILPAPTSIVAAFLTHFSELLGGTAVTLGRMIGAVALSLPPALLLARTIEGRPQIRSFVLPLAQAFAATPRSHLDAAPSRVVRNNKYVRNRGRDAGDFFPAAHPKHARLGAE
jgi:ABC-type nitrate/sulfonate/bicarbonate transport system permease component